MGKEQDMTTPTPGIGIVERLRSFPMDQQLRNEAAAALEQARDALAGLVDAVVEEVNEKGGGGNILARLTDARTCLRTLALKQEVGRA